MDDDRSVPEHDRDPFPEIFAYEAFNGRSGGLTDALKALEKLARLNELAQYGRSHHDYLVVDDALFPELATAVYCAAMHVRTMWTKGQGLVEKDDA